FSFLLLIVFSVFALNGNAQLLTQDFNFSGSLTSNGWTAHSGGGTNALSTTVGLTYNGHAGSGIGNAALVNNIGGEDANTTFTSTSTNGATVYASFLVNVTEAAASKTGDYFFHLGSPGGASWTAYSARVFARVVSGSVNFGLSNTSTATYGTTTYSKNTTYLIILKYTIVTGTTADPVSMWVIPSGMPATEFSAGVAEVNNTTTNGTDAINAVGLRQGSATNSPQVVVDAIRVGTTWASVVPASGSAPSTQASNITFGSATSNSVVASWTAGNGDGRIVKINTANSFVDPTSGASYTANATYSGSGEQVVSTGSGLSATVSNLSPGQTYYFRAYEYSNSGLLYNTTTTAGNPSSITLNYPSPTIASLSPAGATAGGSSFTLTVTGSDFYPASVINWGGSPRTTTYVNSTTLTASISVADIATAGTVNVDVTNPLPGGGTSSSLPFVISASTSPLITVGNSITPFTTVAGTPSTSQSYTVAGSNLTDDIIITPPTGFEIRTGSNTFSASPIVLSFNTYPTVYTVEVAPKDATHPYFGIGSPNGYVLNSVQGPTITMIRGVTYKFYFDGQGTCCSSTLGHPFVFTNSSIGGAANTVDVISDGVIQYGDSTFFTPDVNTPSLIYYMCDVHESMGSQINVIDPPVGNIPTTTIDIRFNPATSGTFTGSLTHTSTGASTQSISLTGFALESEPSTPSTISFGVVSGNSIEVNTTGGSGASRIIVIRQASAVSYSPVDGSSATGVNASFTTALDQGSGNKIVYDGTGNTVNVTNLSSSTTYHFAVYEYNGSGATANYQLAGAGTASTTTLASEPTTAATMSLTRIKSDTCVTGFASGNGTRRLVLISTSPITFVPTDGVAYSGAATIISAAADLGSGNLLVYNDSSKTSLLLSGLAGGTTYYARAYEYNGIGTSINYRTSSFGSLTFTTPSNISYAVAGSNYTQDFNSLPTTGSTGMTGFGLGPYYLSTPAVNAANMTGWQHTLVGGTSADVVFGIDNGGSSSGGVKSYGITGSNNRSLGSLATSSSVPAFGAILINNTGGPLTTITVSYTGQQWRLGGSGTPNRLDFSYAVGSPNITSGVFSTVANLGFQNPVSSGVAAALDGTLPQNQVPVSGTITLNTNWLPGESLAIRWTDLNDAGNDEGLAIDDFIFSAAGPTTPLVQDSAISFVNILTTSMDISWSSGDGSSRIVVMNNTNSFTPPTDGNTYTANTVYSGSGQQVVFDGNGNVVHVDGLTAGTTYYFRVYGYNGFGASTKYNTNTALDNPASQTTAQPSAATKLVITSVNGFADPVTSTPFSVTVQAQDSLGSPQTVSIPTTVTLSLYFGVGSLGGTITGVIPAGSNSVTISGVTYSPEDIGVQLQADATAGETLTSAVSNPFNVLGVATQLSFVGTPPSGILNTTIAPFSVFAYRNDFTIDPNYSGTITLTKYSGPGNIVGTLTATCVGGAATFSNVSFDAPGTYVLEASATGLLSAFSTDIIITLLPTMTELVVPKFIAAKTAAGTHNARVPFAVCLKIDNLVPNTTYDIKAGVGTDTTVATTYGSGNTWLGSSFAIGNIVGAFTTDASGGSGPFWVYIQPTANSTNSRFAAGFNHNIRIGYAPTGGIMPTEPNFVGTKLMTALDIGTTAQTPATTDDGAFLTGSSTACIGGKYILIYDNAAGTGDPISVYQARTMNAPNTISQSELPTAVNDIYLQTSSSPVGSYAALIPIGANNLNGVRRIEARNADNTLFSAATDADGVWSGANTTTITRRFIAFILSTAGLNTIAVTTTSTGESCTGALDGTATASATSVYSPITYSWNSTPSQTSDIATGLGAGTYVVTVTDNVGCTATASAVVSPPAGATITPSGPTTFCSGGSVTLTASAALGYLWSTGDTTQSITVSTSGSYSVTLNTGTCNATTLPTVVTVTNYQFTGTLFSESMGAPSGTTSVNTYAGWQNSSPITFSAGTTGTDVRNTTVSTGYSGASGGGNIFFGTTGGNLKTFTVSGINTLGYSSIVLSYGLLRSDITNGMTVEVSSDGVNYSALTVSQPTTASTWQLITVNSGIPAASNLRIRFSKNFTTSFRLDDIKITGTTSTPSIAVTGSTTVCGSGSAVLYSNIPSGLVWSFNGSTTRSQTVSSSGSYTFVATDGNGCTATAAPVVFTVNPEPTASVTSGTILCNGGTTTVDVTVTGGTAPYTNTGTFTVPAGTYTYVVTDAVGCDDTVSVSITQPAAITGSTTESACDSYTWSANSTTYTASGTYIATLVAANGCDSTVSLNLTITPSSTIPATAAACDNYTWFVNGQTYTQSGVYSSVNGCVTDILTLTITPSTTNTTTVTACDTYTWSVNSQTYTASGTYSSVSGCNTEVLQLTINNCPSGVTLNLTMFIQGYMDLFSLTPAMVPVLNNQFVSGAIGTEVDTVTITLYDSVSATAVESKQAILSVTGNATATFTQVTAGTSYWIGITHRNALETWSAAPVLCTATTSYSFASSLAQAYSIGLDPMIEVVPGTFALWTGDLNQDDFIDATDFTLFDLDNAAGLLFDYYATDMNGDGFVDASDYIIYDANGATAPFFFQP
ncbi:MAG: hypothetical protein RIQ47_1630, partial [Bacteroidota bacterium]